MKLGLIGAAGILLVLVLVGTAIAGQRGAVERETLVRTRVWCDALVERDALRYQDSFRRGYFKGHFDRFANIYREPTEVSILAQMPVTTDCRAAGPPRRSKMQGEVFVPVVRRAPNGRSERIELRMRRDAGFWVVWQLVKPG
jgi:hypothetical protein